MEAVVLKALSKQRTERYASVEAFVLALRGSFVRPEVSVPSPKAQPPLAPTSPEMASRSNTKEEWFSVGMNHRKAKRYEEALAAFDQAIRLDPRDANAYNNKGNALNALKRHEEALVAYDQTIRLDPNNADAYNNKGNVLRYALKRYEEALAVYDQAIHLNLDPARAYGGKGLALSSLRRYEESLAALDQAIRLDPNTAS